MGGKTIVIVLSRKASVPQALIALSEARLLMMEVLEARLVILLEAALWIELIRTERTGTLWVLAVLAVIVSRSVTMEVTSLTLGSAALRAVVEVTETSLGFRIIAAASPRRINLPIWLGARGGCEPFNAELLCIHLLEFTWHLTEPARIASEPEELESGQVRHAMNEHAALLGEVTLSGAHPVGAIDLGTEHTRRSRVVALVRLSASAGRSPKVCVVDIA